MTKGFYANSFITLVVATNSGRSLFASSPSPFPPLPPPPSCSFSSVPVCRDTSRNNPELLLNLALNNDC